MDWILGWSTTVACLVALLYFHFTKVPLGQRIRERFPTITQKVVLALLAGFMVFTILSEQMPGIGRKLLLVGISAALIAGLGIRLPEGKKPE